MNQGGASESAGERNMRLGEISRIRDSVAFSDALPRPTLWAIPSPVVRGAADVTLRCQGHLGSDQFQLWKDGELREERNATWQKAEFVLRNVDECRDARSYSCRSGQGSWWSELSEGLAMVVTDEGLLVYNHPWWHLTKPSWAHNIFLKVTQEPSYPAVNRPTDLGALPKPSISASHDSTIFPGATVTIWCQMSSQAPPQDYSCALLEAKSLEPLQQHSPAGTWAVFSLLSVRPEDTGSYSCIYYKKKAPFSGSHPSQAVKLTVLGQLPRPTLWAQPGLRVAPGANITLWCSRPKLSSLEEVTFTLWKAGTLWPLQQQASTDLWTSFLLPSVRPENTGSYSCSYRDRRAYARGSKPTKVLELVVTDSLPKPSLSAWPGPEVASGANVTLLCQGPSWSGSLVLHKDGDEKMLPSTQDGAKFFLTHVTPQHSGNYSCSYQLPTNGRLWTEHSEPLQLRVTGSQPSDTLIIILSCVSSLLLLLCLLLLALLCQGSIRVGSSQGESPRRCLSFPCLSWTTCLPHQPEGPREETLYTEVAKKRPRERLVTKAEDPQGMTYTQLNIRTLNERKTDRMKTPTEPIIYSTVPRD
ncbi:leukocyte immunoglobulin-like receptor subfamily B member 3 [Vombatus ursinus]|uniref:leukocyte immunoglobulin-like receptor subfamily B member 3 n=1 Tax=Vombatus ursinus TaxID=29139 RepID=UPI000FFD59EA|nr:leukocyte immunoglobulin-like receptor subfamily B member 3 [Vombatus ursinus]